MYKFLGGLNKNDRVILVGDIRQHQSVEAGRIFEELQKAGMKTAQLNKVMRQKDEDLKRAVVLMANGKIAEGVAALKRQGRVHEVAHRDERLAAIARAYVESLENTLVVSPDNKSRQEINSAIRQELKRESRLGYIGPFRSWFGKMFTQKIAGTFTPIGPEMLYASTLICQA